MNKITQWLYAVCIAVLTFSCIDKQEAAPTNVVETKLTDNQSAALLTLNMGEKWLADFQTGTNVNNLKKRAEEFRQNDDPELQDYHNAGKEFQDVLNTLIKECRMKGADHDALHLWLEPLLLNVKELNASESVTQADEIMKTIEKSIETYFNYFQS